LIPDQVHGFDQFNARGKKFEASRLELKHETYQSMADWLSTVFAEHRRRYD
jgi:hypothetical protein